MVVGLGEGGGCVEFILATVRMQKLAFDGVPLDLYETMRRYLAVVGRRVAGKRGKHSR